MIDHDVSYIQTIKNVLSPEECAAWIERIKANNPTNAPITTTEGETLDTDIRNNRRVMFDDPESAKLLFERVKRYAPPRCFGWKLVGANERLRCYEYQPGHYFKPHMDGPFVRDIKEQSYYTFMVYLNHDFAGGETSFMTEPEKVIVPETGMALLFQHPIIHEGCPVRVGTKYVIRTDLMYRNTR
ncbi:MAG: 2OG-Fe(II) oxygenase [Acidobacteria bacterium]|nr:2OG-Fe(II) oxygenase [Acidobacteriota bacterium]